MLIRPSSLFIFFLVSLVLGGCVGTVQNASQGFTNVVDPPQTRLEFAGAATATAISDSRIEVFFFPANGGSGKYTYDLLVGSSPYPISIPSDVLTPDYRGLLRVTLTGLTRLTTYQVKVEVRDTNNGQSNSQIVKSVTTYDNQECDYDGISSAYNMSGQDGKDSIRVRWTPARTSGGITKQTWDPKLYEIIAVDANRLTPGDMDVSSNGIAEGRWVFQLNHDDAVNEYVMRGLPTATKFYVRMRAIHEGSIDDVYDPKKRSEQNTKYLTISTLSGSLADLTFQPDSFAVSLAPGEQGLYAITGSWTAASGVFDHFRLYYSKDGAGAAAGNLPSLCLTPIQSAVSATVFCKKVDFNQASSPITGLAPYTGYEVVLILCQTTECDVSERITSPARMIITDPNSPAFNGIRDLVMAQSLNEIGSLQLKFDPPNFTQGYFDGLLIKMRRTTDGSDAEVNITEVTSPVSNGPYNFLADNTATVTGIDYLSDSPYCFTIYPFKYESDGITKRETPNNIWKCVQPQVIAPTVDQFPGLASARTTDSTITVNWGTPSSGVYASYELFWRKLSTQFSWGDAISQAANNFDYTNYGRRIVSQDDLSATVDNLPNGSYVFGIVTYYSYVTDNGIVTLRSETNGGLYTCHVNNTMAGNTVDCTR